MNPIQMIQTLLGKGNNPQQVAVNMMKTMGTGNPMLNNLIGMAQKGEGNNIEEFARNLFKERGRDFDKEFGEFMSNFKQ